MTAPFFLFAIANILGLAFSFLWTGNIIFCGLLLGGGVFCCLFLRKTHKPWRYSLLLLIFALGFCYGEAREALQPEDPFANTETAVLQGQIVSDPLETDTSRKFRFTVDTVDGKELKDPVDVNVLSEKGSGFQYGDELKLNGKFLVSEVNNPGGFDYDEYQEQRGLFGTFSVMYGGSAEVVAHRLENPFLRFAFGLKHRFERSLSYLPADQSVLIKGIFFGDTSGLDYRTSDILSKSGIRHCFAVSGLHVGYVLLFLNALGGLFRFGRKGKAALILPCLFLYAAMTGFSPSVLRASIMCLMVLGAGIFGREKNSFNGLGAAALLLLLWDPQMLLQSGFQLSFIAMFSILFFMPWLERCVPGDFPGKGPLFVTIAAQIGMIPILAYMFHVVSIVSFFVSTVCCLLVGGMVVLCFGALILSIVAPVFGAVLLIPCGLIGKMILAGVSFGVELPFAYLYKGDFGILWLLLIYALLCLIVALPKLKERRVLPLVLMAALFTVFLFPVAGEKEELEITFLSVGEGDAIYLRLPNGDDVMMDAGDPKEGSVGYYTIRPFLLSRGVDDLERVILSHNDDDHSGAVAYLAESFGIENYVIPSAASASFEDVLGLAERDDADITFVSAGDVLDLGGGVKLEVFWPERASQGESNELSLVAKLTYGDFSVLFTGDVEGSGLKALEASREDISADILKIPHHGSKNSFDEVFYEKADPDAVLISVGPNSYGHPSEEVVSYWQKHHVDCYRTDLCGAVTVVSDGRGYDISLYRDEEK